MNNMLQYVNHHRTCEAFYSQNVVKSFWKKFLILDAIDFIKKCWDEVKELTLNKSWYEFLLELVNHPINDQECQEMIHDVIRKVGGKGFEDLIESEMKSRNLLRLTNSS